MKDHAHNWKSVPLYKEVVIIGNGPSGLALSYILSGRWPYYNGKPHPDPMLTLRLQSISRSRSLLEQDLSFLSLGVEGRASSAVGCLMDAMLHPGADQGLDLDPLIDWRYHKRIDHVVIGKGPPGGTWQEMDSDILTLSLSSWMELPGLRFDDWEKEMGCTSRGNRRVRVSKVAKYYYDYVRRLRLCQYQKRGVVTSVSRYDQVIDDDSTDKKINWKIEVDDGCCGKKTYFSRYVVLATGSHDSPNKLNIRGEDMNWVHHDITGMDLQMSKEEEVADKKPVLVVGAGLSALDAILAARQRGHPVYHVFRRTHLMLDKMLSPAVYPEYYQIHEMMTNSDGCWLGYTPYPGYTLQEILEQSSPHNKRLAKIESVDNCRTLEVGSVAILIGAKPNLEFFKCDNLGVFHGEIDSRSNPIDVDPFTYELRSQPYIYAIGPITGDNLVRYILGGVIAVSSHINSSVNS